MRFGRVFFILVILFCAIETARLWTVAPAQMAAHFNVQGDPDRFAPREQVFAFELQTALVVIVLGFVVQVLTVFVPPAWINLPNREYWLAPERRDLISGRMGGFAGWVFGVILLAVHAGFELTVAASLHAPIRFQAGAMMAVMAAAFFVVFGLLLWLGLSFRSPRD